MESDKKDDGEDEVEWNHLHIVCGCGRPRYLGRGPIPDIAERGERKSYDREDRDVVSERAILTITVVLEYRSNKTRIL